jgi:two-component system OmpR family sensor kinase
MSLRDRVLLALLVVVATGLGASDVVTYKALDAFLVQRVDKQIDDLRRPILDRVLRGGHGEGGRIILPGTESYSELRDPSNQVVLVAEGGSFGNGVSSTPAIPAVLPTPPACVDPGCSASAIIEVPAKEAGGPRYRAHVYPLPGAVGTLVVALSLKDAADTLRRLFFVEALVTVLVIAGAGILGFYLVRLGLRPLTEIEATAGAIAAGDLSQRVRRAEPGTEVGRLGVALNAMLAQIESAFTQKDESEGRLRRFLADASHELRTPLTSIRGYAELFRRGAGERPEDLAKVMSRIEEESRRMGIMVDDLLLLARLDQGRPLERAPLDLAAVVRDSVEAARAVEPEREIALSAEGRLMINGDAARLRQVVDNLMANVRTHAGPGASAAVEVRVRDGLAVLSVSDDGPGLPVNGRERLFSRFFRADPGRSRDQGGAGLGLSIVDAIVRAHGGSVTAEDGEPRGAVFRVELPLPNDGLRSSQEHI